MKRITRCLRIRGLLSAVLLLVGLSACENNPVATEDDAAESELSLFASDLSTDLDLASESADGFHAMITRHDGRNPGFLWYVAADLQQNLTEEQKARLLELASGRLAGPRPGGLPLGGHGMHETDQSAGEEVWTAMIDALDLDADQQALLRSLLAEHREAVQALMQEARESEADRETIRASLEALQESFTAELAGVLTAEQFETFQIHQALMLRLNRFRARHGGAGPNGTDGAGPNGGARGPGHGLMGGPGFGSNG